MGDLTVHIIQLKTHGVEQMIRWLRNADKRGQWLETNVDASKIVSYLF